jgi:hypothetical protein
MGPQWTQCNPRQSKMKAQKKQVRGKEISGIVEDAKELGVSRQYLHRVLTGRQHSARVKQAYRILQREKAFRQLEEHAL